MKATCCVLLTMLNVASAVDDPNVRRRQLMGCITPPTFSPVHIVSEYSAMALHAKADGAVVQSLSSSSNADNWRFVDAGGGHYRVISERTNGAMIAAGGDFDNGIAIQVSTATFTDSRDRWCLTTTAPAVYQLINAKTSKVVDVAAYSRLDGSIIHQWQNNESINQKWRFSTDTGRNDLGWNCAGLDSASVYHILPTHSGMALSISGDAPGANVIQTRATAGSNDDWKLLPTTNGFYHIVAQNNGLTMTAAGYESETNVVLRAATQNWDDDWCFVAVANNNYAIRHRLSGKALDVARISLQDGGNLHLWEYYGGGNQHFSVVVAQPAPPAAQLQTRSSWQTPVGTPVIAASAAHLPDGKILMWSSIRRGGLALDPSIQTWTAIYNPSDGGMTEQLVTQTNHDMFCPGTTVLPNGVVMISGGANSRATTFYDYRNNQWSVGPQMIIPRGYQAHTLLASGEVFSYGGSWSGDLRQDKAAEVWSPSRNAWSLLPGVPSAPAQTADREGAYRSDNHYWLFLAPGGRIFHAGPSSQMHWITTNGDGTIVPSIRRGDDDDAMNGNAVMYDIGKILTLGGARDYASGPASKRAYIIDINGSEASVKRTKDMQFARSLVNSVVLPNGEVVVVGGQTSVRLFSDDFRVLEAEIWNPSTEAFRTLAPMRIPRTYHAVALLLKDGRVWAAGGGLCDCGANHQDFEILTPPYLYNADGSFATRPSIRLSPGSARAGNDITVITDTSGSHTFALIKTSAVTHSVNNDQRRVPLSQVNQSGNRFILRIPSNTNVSLPGDYFLFAMNANGVPSIAATLRIEL